MTLVFRPGFMFDADASTYIEAVEAADTQTLETPVRYAINDFVIGCKQDGIWNPIKASCILAGARTLTGALVPLVGTAPTNVGGLFVADDYNRKTGLVGNGSSKWLNSNRNNNADPQDNNHNSVFISAVPTVSSGLVGTASSTLGHNNIFAGTDANGLFMRSRSATLFSLQPTIPTGFAGHTRSQAGSFLARAAKVTQTAVRDSGTPSTGPIQVFTRDTSFTNARLAFYSIGESLNLALLDARVTDLINTFERVIS